MAQSSRRLQVAAAIGIAALGVAVVVKRAQGNDEPDYKAIGRVIASTADGRTVLTNSAVVAYYMRDLHPHLDRPFGLGRGDETAGGSFLVVDDDRVANSPRPGPGSAHAFGPVYVRATP